MNDDVFQKTAEAGPHRGVLDPKDFSDHYRFCRFIPPEDLVPYVAHIWIISWDFPEGQARTSPQVLPDPQVNLFFSAEGAGVQGVYKAKRSYAAAGKGRTVGITFRPAGFYAWWPHSAALITDTSRVLEDIFPQVDETFVHELLGASDEAVRDRLVALLRQVPPVFNANIGLVQKILAGLSEDPDKQTVEAVARAWCKSERALQDLFARYVGVGLKWVLLRNRLLAAAEKARNMKEPDWAGIAVELGYNSQAHFITDFKRMVGASPTRYIERLATTV